MSEPEDRNGSGGREERTKILFLMKVVFEKYLTPLERAT